MAPLLRGVLRVRVGGRAVAGVGVVRRLWNFLRDDGRHGEGARRRHRSRGSARGCLRMVQPRHRPGRAAGVSHLRLDLGPFRIAERIRVWRDAGARRGDPHGGCRSFIATERGEVIS